MKALLLKQYMELEYTELPQPAIGDEDVLIRVRACGICGSDIHGIDGSTGRRIPPLVMGHEAAGIIEHVGKNVTAWKPGDRVTFDSMVSCGKCHFCRRGQVNLCDSRQVLGVSCGDYRRNGAFAEYVNVPSSGAVKIPGGVSPEVACVIGCAVQTGVGAVFPAGPMREPLARGLARADAVVILLPPGVEYADPRLIALFVAKPVLIARLEAAAPPPAGPQLGFAGVGKPWKIERALKDAGCQLVGFESFPDHAAYDAATLEGLAQRAAALGAGLVTTEKDWARLPADWRPRVAAWPVRARFKDEAALDALLSRQL